MWARYLLPGALIALAAAYCLQLGTPLRLEEDSAEYLILGAQIADGDGLPVGAAFPPGLPALVAVLDVVGLAGSPAFVAMNLGFLAIGLLAAASLLRREFGYGRAGIVAVCVLTLLSFNTIRLTTHPMSEVPFFGISLTAVALAAGARQRASSALLGSAAVCAVVAVAFRTFGVALLPALVVASSPRTRRIGAALGVPAVLLLGIFGPVRYVDDAVARWSSDPLSLFGSHLVGLLEMFGAVATNVPLERSPEWARWLFPLVGLGAVVLAFLGARRLGRRAPISLAYLGGTAAVLLAWPFEVERFLLPVTPLLIACVVESLRSGRAWLARGGWAWAATYALAGLVALAVSTRITFSGERFPDRYGSGFRDTYRVAWQGGDPAAGPPVDERLLWALRRYESRAVGEPGPRPPT